jgi:chaperonin GroES
MLIEAVQQITSVSDILSGNQDTQTAPTTALALIEQGQKVFTAIYQRIHRALGNEIKIMRGLNRDYLDEEQYFALDDNPQVVGKADYEDKDLDVLPVSDPRAINDRVKMAKAQVLMAHNGDPLVNQLEIRKREFEAAGIDNIKPLLTYRNSRHRPKRSRRWPIPRTPRSPPRPRRGPAMR